MRCEAFALAEVWLQLHGAGKRHGKGKRAHHLHLNAAAQIPFLSHSLAPIGGETPFDAFWPRASNSPPSLAQGRAAPIRSA